MPRIFDNIEQELLGALRARLAVLTRADLGKLHLKSCDEQSTSLGGLDVDD